MNFKFSMVVAAAFLMLVSVANAQSGSRSAAPAFSAPAQSFQSVPSTIGSSSRTVAPAQSFQSVPSTIGSSSRTVAPAQSFQSVPSAVGSSSRTAAPVQSFQSVPSAGGSSSRLAAPITDTAPTQSYVPSAQSYVVPTQSYYPSAGCCQSYSVPTYSAPRYNTRSWGGGWFGRRGCGY